MERSFSDDNREHYLEHQYRPMPKLWSKNQFEMKVFQADDVFTSDEGSYFTHLIHVICLTYHRCLYILN